MNTKLPKTWAYAPLDTLCDRLRGVSYEKGETSPTAKTGYLPILKANNLDNDRLMFDDLVWVPAKRIRDQQKLRRGDIIIAMSSGSTRVVGKTGQLLDDWDGSFGAFCGVLRPYVQLNSRYIGLFLLTDDYRTRISNLAAGTNINNLKAEHFSEIEVPLAPLPEQRRIVEKLEKLLAKVEVSRKRLEKIPRILKRFRQSVLAAACSGKLTADWREERTSPQSIHTVVDAIRSSRENSAETPAKKAQVRDIFEYREDNDPSELPESWSYVALSKLCKSFDYGSSRKSQSTGRISVLRMGNIQNGRIDWSELVYTSDEHEIGRYSLNPRTVLFNRTNSPELVGKTAIYRGEQPAIFAGYLIRINPLDALDPEYLNLCLNTQYARSFCYQVKTDGVSQSNINAQKLGIFEVPFCCIEEQHEIVRRVEQLFAHATQIEERYKKANAHIQKLTQSILAKAFRGELVPQDPNDEPASILLERIRAERAKPAEESDHAPENKEKTPLRTKRRSKTLKKKRLKKHKKSKR